MTDGPFGRRSDPVEPEESPDPVPRRGPAPAPPTPPRGISSVTWILGVLVILALAYITLNSLRTDGPGSRGVGEGEALPKFAAPLATGSLEGDAQVDERKACAVRGPEVLNSCALTEKRAPIVLGFMALRSEQCEQQIDRLDRVAQRHPDVQFAAIGIRGEKSELARAARRWRMPVAHDRDGAVSNLFAVAICPTITFAGSDGKVVHTSLGLIDEAEIERQLAELE